MPRNLSFWSAATGTLKHSPQFEVQSVQSSEALGELFHYTVVLQTPDAPELTALVAANLPYKQMVGHEAGLLIEVDGGDGSVGARAGDRCPATRPSFPGRSVLSTDSGFHPRLRALILKSQSLTAEMRTLIEPTMVRIAPVAEQVFRHSNFLGTEPIMKGALRSSCRLRPMDGLHEYPFGTVGRWSVVYSSAACLLDFSLFRGSPSDWRRGKYRTTQQ